MTALSFEGTGRSRSGRVWEDKSPRGRAQLLRVDEADGLEDVVDRDVASLDLLGGDPVQEAPETAVADHRRDRHGFGAELPEDDLLHRLAAHRELAGQTLEKDEPPGVEVGARRGRLAAQLLGSSVARGAQELARSP